MRNKSSPSTLLSVLSVQETLDSNHTSNQLLSVLDLALHNAIEAIVYNTNWLNIILSNVITWYSDNSRRKISSTVKDKEGVYEILLSVMLSSDPEYKMTKLKSLQLERSLWFKTLKLFIHLCPENTTNYHNFQFLKHPNGSLYIARRNAVFWLDVAEKMKSQIMEKYMRFVGTRALSAKKKHHDIDLDDTIQNYTVALSQAIDKCSSDRGTLTSYIEHWFMSAQTKSRSEEYGTAYSVPDNVRKEFFTGRSSNLYVPFQDLANEETSEISIPPLEDNNPIHSLVDDGETYHLLRLAKHADPQGFARYSLGLREILM